MALRQTDRQSTAPRPNEPALPGPPAQLEAPKKPAMPGQEHWWPPREDVARRARGAAPPATTEAPPGPRGALPLPRRRWASGSLHGPSPEAGGLRSRGWAVPSVLGERQGQGRLEGRFLIDAVVLQDRK